MRIRTIAGSALAAAGLMTALAGAASASTPDPGEPSGEALIVICKDGKATVRPPTEDERARLEAVRAGKAGAERIWIAPDSPGAVHVGPADDAFHVPPHGKRVKVLMIGPDPHPGQKAPLACDMPGERPRE
ncbi:hypothetical protein [Pseudonocardia sp.]|jgi:hypothetical protein|uniref:hypothetical protein n=1 Tax=Pseudonocardia sp. TaxID=60912 RepID=UPI0031FC968F